MLDHDERLEALTAILGAPVKTVEDIPYKKNGHSPMSVGDFVIASILNGDNRWDTVEYFETSDDDEDDELIERVRDWSLGEELFIDERDFFEPRFDFDFRKVSRSNLCVRGDEPYKRPLGWYRLALKVLDKYPDGNEWLGTDGWRSHSVVGEWPVCYHGTGLDGAKGIITSNFRAGRGELFGRGIYSTPDIRVAQMKRYAKTFQSQKTGKTYRVVLQNRINPAERKVCDLDSHWLIEVPKGTPPEVERQIVERSIRPYGILVQEVEED